MVFKNGSSSTLDMTSWGVPSMGETIQGWFQPMIFILITKSVEDFRLEEISEEISFRGVWQPYSAQQLQMAPEGQRAWKWFTVHAEVSLKLNPDEVIEYRGVKYRIRDKMDYTEYDYVEYHLVQDYEE